MSNDHVVERLWAFADGDLGEAEFQEVELHLAACAWCRDQERAVRALLSEASSLAREVTPRRDLWPGIAASIRTQGQASRFTWAGALAALAAGLAVVTLVTARGSLTAVAPGARTLSVASDESARLAELEKQYDLVTAELLTALNARRESLPPETVASVEEDLRSIDEALGRLRTALASDPSDPGLNHLLASTHQKKVNALRHVVRLTTRL